MKGDFTRMTFDSKKHYNRVLMQQGRVQLDADWNEQLDITAHREETGTVDVIGRCGTPLAQDGFRLVVNASTLPTADQQRLASLKMLPLQPGDFLVGPGRYYVHGKLCENEDYLLYTRQSDLPGDDPAKAPSQPDLEIHPIAEDGLYLVYLDVWEHHVTALDDELIREKALGGSDTATRAKTVWQVKFNKLDANTYNCMTAPMPKDESTGRLSARAKSEETPKDDCDIPPGAGYRRLENQLYRVEIHKGGALSKATFKWSRDNASTETRWMNQIGNDLILSSSGPDQVLGFGPNQWVELTDDTREMQGKPGTLVKLTNAVGQVLTIDPATASGPHELSYFPLHPKVRRWDTISTNGVRKTDASDTPDHYIKLEDGLEIKFEAGEYRPGDYWLIPARTATADVEWPRDDNHDPIPQSKHGINHYICSLGLVKFSQGNAQPLTLEGDCRQLFPLLTDLIQFQCLSGDGQETLPGEAVPQLLQVGVTVGRWPAGKAPLNLLKSFKVRFQPLDAGGQVAPNKDALSTPSPGTASCDCAIVDGIASCAWRPANDQTRPSQQVQAVLLDSNSTPTSHPPIIFNADLSLARLAAYTPNPDCDVLSSPGTVQQALEALCKQKAGGTCTFTATPGPGWESVFDKIIDGQDAQICFQAGTYDLATTVSVPKKGNLKLVGAGKGTRIVVGKSEAAFVFQNCKSVLIRDMSVIAEVASSQSDAKHLNGALTFRECGSVTIEDTELACAPGLSRSATCVTVASIITGQEKPQVPCSVRIQHCDFRIGYQQTGILLLNPTRAHVEDNFLEVRPKPHGMRATEFLRNSRQYRSRIRSTMISNASYGEKLPPAGSFNITLNIQEQTIRFMTHPMLVNVWPKLSQNLKNVSIETPKALLDAIIHIANQVLLRRATASVTNLFANWYRSTLQNSPSVAMSGIVVGGQTAQDIRIINNTIRGVVRGVHVGVSYGALHPNKQASTGTVMIAGNTIGISLPADAAALERHGIFAGNCDNLTIENNYVRIHDFSLTKPSIEGIRVYGYLGRKMIVHRNHLVNVTTGILVKPLNVTGKSLWLVTENMMPNSTLVVQAPSSVYKSNNFA